MSATEEPPVLGEVAKAIAVLDRLRERLERDDQESALGEAEWLTHLAARILGELGPRTPVGRGRVLELARAVTEDRDETYGDASESFERIARLWSVLFGRDVRAHEVALALDLMKTARLIARPDHVDSWVDKAGYAACGAEAATVVR